MLSKVEEKAAKKGLSVPLVCCDFRDLTKHNKNQFSCVMSTGNALAHVDHAGIEKTLKEMASLVKSGGYLYFDMASRSFARMALALIMYKCGTTILTAWLRSIFFKPMSRMIKLSGRMFTRNICIPSLSSTLFR